MITELILRQCRVDNERLWAIILFGPHHAKTCLRAYADSKAQISLCIHAVWTVPSLLTESFDIIVCINEEQMPGWDFAHVQYESESVHFALIRRWIFLWRGPFGDELNSVSSRIWPRTSWSKIRKAKTDQTEKQLCGCVSHSHTIASQSDQLLSVCRNLGSLAILTVPTEDWSNCKDAQADLSFH